MSRRLLGLFLIVATLTLGYGSVFALLAEIRARFGFDDWAIGMIGAAGFAAGFASQAFLSCFADRGYLRRLLGGGLAYGLHRRNWAVIVFLRQLRHCSSTPHLPLERRDLVPAPRAIVPPPRRHTARTMIGTPSSDGRNQNATGGSTLQSGSFGPLST